MYQYHKAIEKFKYRFLSHKFNSNCELISLFWYLDCQITSQKLVEIEKRKFRLLDDPHP